MISIITYNNYFQSMITRVPGIMQVHLVANEAQLAKLLTKDIEYPVLIATIPSGDNDSRDSDSVVEKNTGLIFILEKIADSDREGANIDMMDKLQLLMAGVKNAMKADYEDCDLPGHSVMSRLELQSMHQDPE
ncbi:MAG: hypothetical protein ACOYN5_04460, partial [Bacteroidales bacterium]